MAPTQHSAGLHPSALVARTLQVYSLALVKDVTTIGEEPPLLPPATPPSDDVQLAV